MEAILKENNYDLDITREECIEKRSGFFKCVLEKKAELTKTLSNEEWNSYNNRVHKISFDCYQEKGLKKCESYFNFYDINY